MVRAMAVDDVDSKIIGALARNARATNAELGLMASVAPSTAYTRVRYLRERGVITGFHAAVDETLVGNEIQALILVSLQASFRQDNITSFIRSVCRRPEVVQLFFVSGAGDFLVHVAVPSVGELRQFVLDNLSGQERVASTDTSVIFEYRRNRVVAEFG